MHFLISLTIKENLSDIREGKGLEIKYDQGSILQHNLE